MRKLGSLLAITFLILASCGGSGSDTAASATTSTEVATTTTEADDAGAEEAKAPCPKAKEPKKLPGREFPANIVTGEALYHPAEFRPAFTVKTYGMAYPFIAEMDTGCFFAMHTGELGGILFIRPAFTYKPGTLELEKGPADLVRWVTSHPNLEITEQGPATLGGVEGTRMKVALRKPPKEGPSFCEKPCVAIAGNMPDSVYVIEAGYPAIWTLLEVDGVPLIVSVEAPAQNLKELSGFATRLLKTLEFVS